MRFKKLTAIVLITTYSSTALAGLQDALDGMFMATGKSRPIGTTESRPNGASGRCCFSSFGRGCF